MKYERHLPCRERIFSRWIWRLPTGNGRIALTFDDGPSPETTPALIHALSELRIPATFFLTGQLCREYPDLVRLIASNGHTLANHGFTHRSMLWQGARTQQQSIQQTADCLREITGFASSLYRPPFGQFNFRTYRALNDTGHRGVLWSVIARDWIAQTDEVLWQTIANRLHDGAILVLHDGHPSTTPSVIRILPRLVDDVARRGWEFVSLRSQELSTLR